MAAQSRGEAQGPDSVQARQSNLSSVRDSVGRCYDDGVCPKGIHLGRVVEDEGGERFIVNEEVEEVKEQWLKERLVIVVFQGDARSLSRAVKEDLIRAFEDGWSMKKLFQPEARRGRVKFEGPNVASYVVKAKEIAGWLIQQKEMSIKLEEGKNYTVQFSPRLSKQELKVVRIQEAESKSWIMALRVPLEAYFYLGSAVEAIFGRSKIRWGSECCEADYGGLHKSASSSSLESSAQPVAAKDIGPEGTQAGIGGPVTPGRNQMESVQRCLVPLLCTKAKDRVYLLALTDEDGSPKIQSQVVECSPTPALIMTTMKDLYGEHVPVRLVPHSSMVSVICEMVQGYTKMYFPILDARIPPETASLLAQSGVRWVHMDLVRERNMQELEAIKVLLGISGLVLLNVNEKLLLEENLHLEFLAQSLSDEWSTMSRASSSWGSSSRHTNSRSKASSKRCESKLNETKLREFAGWWDGPQIWSPAQGTRGGVGILIHKDMQAQVIDAEADLWGRWAWIKAVIGGEKWVLMTVYAPTNWRERAKFFLKLKTIVPKADRLLVVGDWNVSLDEALRPGAASAGRGDVQALLDLNAEMMLLNPFPVLNQEDPGYTWFSNLFRNRQDITRRRLDYFLLSEEILERVTAVRQFCHPMSDHKPVVVEAAGAERGKGFFRLNSQVLEEPGIGEWVEDHMSRWEEARPFFETPTDWLDGGIAIVSGVLDVCSRILARARNSKEAEYLRKIEEAEDRMEGHPISVMYARLYYSNILTSRRPHDNVDTDLSLMSDTWEDTTTGLHGGGKLDLDRPLTLEEISQMLKTMAKGKSPRVDGLTVEFYAANWVVFGPLLVELYNGILVGGKLGKGMTHGVIVVLFKKGDKADVRNWRPISLLNVSYKILGKSLARRLARYLLDLVAPDQVAFVQGRSIFDNIVTTIETLEVVQNENLDYAVLLLDLEKAYGKVGWTFVLTTLHWLGFGEGFYAWVIALYTFSTAFVMINGHLSEPFPLTRSLRQGCPLAPLIFVIQLEVLLNKIRAQPVIRGLQLHTGNECKVKALADDLFAVCENSVPALSAMKSVLCEYSVLSEASVNWSKSTYLLPAQFELKVEWGMKRVAKGEEERFLGVMISLQVEASSQGFQLQQRIASRLRLTGGRKKIAIASSIDRRADRTDKMSHKKSCPFTLVPWHSNEEWDQVRRWLLSTNTAEVQLGIDRVISWKGRGHVQPEVEVTAYLVDLMSKDPEFSPLVEPTRHLPENVLRLGYAMAMISQGKISNKRDSQKKWLRVLQNDVRGLEKVLIAAWHGHQSNGRRGNPRKKLLKRASDLLHGMRSDFLPGLVHNLVEFGILKSLPPKSPTNIFETGVEPDTAEKGLSKDLGSTLSRRFTSCVWKMVISLLSLLVPTFPMGILMGVMSWTGHLGGKIHESMDLPTVEIEQQLSDLFAWVHWLLVVKDDAAADNAGPNSDDDEGLIEGSRAAKVEPEQRSRPGAQKRKRRKTAKRSSVESGTDRAHRDDVTRHNNVVNAITAKANTMMPTEDQEQEQEEEQEEATIDLLPKELARGNPYRGDLAWINELGLKDGGLMDIKDLAMDNCIRLLTLCFKYGRFSGSKGKEITSYIIQNYPMDEKRRHSVEKLYHLIFERGPREPEESKKGGSDKGPPKPGNEVPGASTSTDEEMKREEEESAERRNCDAIEKESDGAGEDCPNSGDKVEKEITKSRRVEEEGGEEEAKSTPMDVNQDGQARAKHPHSNSQSNISLSSQSCSGLTEAQQRLSKLLEECSCGRNRGLESQIEEIFQDPNSHDEDEGGIWKLSKGEWAPCAIGSLPSVWSETGVVKSLDWTFPNLAGEEASLDAGFQGVGEEGAEEPMGEGEEEGEEEGKEEQDPCREQLEAVEPIVAEGQAHRDDGSPVKRQRTGERDHGVSTAGEECMERGGQRRSEVPEHPAAAIRDEQNQQVQALQTLGASARSNVEGQIPAPSQDTRWPVKRSMTDVLHVQKQQPPATSAELAFDGFLLCRGLPIKCGMDEASAIRDSISLLL
ncbi:hypothetical protein CBR_g41105 [Chara braunii]|uniref:Reverse transcriptase domain-containing protein n=1 Tax=Chara braunii TaxID=69332 RepID=A0A388LVB4_CHABU|nr:hypothetical protein CBR_g41105 [Chara braunii]|eukprot:GBG86201.1 hypothetical protein CBR_g41105 [Chara braunii]